MTWPNKITYTRILMIPAFVIAALEVNEYPFFRYVTIAAFAIIALGDALDGYVARHFNLSAREGKIIDPLADKLIMVTACIMLALPIWGLEGQRAPLRPEVATIVVARDALICIWVLVAYLAGEKRVFEPSKLGQFTTFFQMLMIAAALVGTLKMSILDYIAAPLSYIAAVLTIASGSQYLYRYAKGRGFQHDAGTKPQ
jgi:CDP-diacylglycerol--glycerol-3-phosphate 3-phosphatidyltransferase